MRSASTICASIPTVLQSQVKGIPSLRQRHYSNCDDASRCGKSFCKTLSRKSKAKATTRAVAAFCRKPGRRSSRCRKRQNRPVPTQASIEIFPRPHQNGSYLQVWRRCTLMSRRFPTSPDKKREGLGEFTASAIRIAVSFFPSTKKPTWCTVRSSRRPAFARQDRPNSASKCCPSTEQASHALWQFLDGMRYRCVALVALQAGPRSSLAWVPSAPRQRSSRGALFSLIGRSPAPLPSNCAPLRLHWRCCAAD